MKRIVTPKRQSMNNFGYTGVLLGLLSIFLFLMRNHELVNSTAMTWVAGIVAYMAVVSLVLVVNGFNAVLDERDGMQELEDKYKLDHEMEMKHSNFMTT